MRKVKMFLSGPMTGLPDFNRSDFFFAEDVLRSKGHIVLNPGFLPNGLKHGQYMKICLSMIDAVECVVMLPGWDASNGAKVEYNYARGSGLPIFEASRCTLETKTGKVDFEDGLPTCASVNVFDTNSASNDFACGFSLTVLSAGVDVEMPQLNEI